MDMDEFLRNMAESTRLFSTFERTLYEGIMDADEVRANFGYGAYSNGGERIHFTRDPRTDDNTNTKITTKKPREGFIDGGIVLTKGVTITRNQFEDMDSYQWAQFKEFVESMDNLRVNEIGSFERPDALLYIYDVPPNISSMPL